MLIFKKFSPDAIKYKSIHKETEIMKFTLSPSKLQKVIWKYRNKKMNEKYLYPH